MTQLAQNIFEHPLQVLRNLSAVCDIQLRDAPAEPTCDLAFGISVGNLVNSFGSAGALDLHSSSIEESHLPTPVVVRADTLAEPHVGGISPSDILLPQQIPNAAPVARGVL